MSTPLENFSTKDLTDLFEEQCSNFITAVKEEKPTAEIESIKKSLMEIITQLHHRIDSKISLDIPLN